VQFVPLPFAMQRVVFLALLLGMVFYTVAAAVLLQTVDGGGLATEPVPLLDDLAAWFGLAALAGAVVLHRALRARAARLDGAARTAARFRATLVPLAVLEGGCLFGVTTWLLNGCTVPGLVVALVLLSAAVLIVPFTDPDART